MKPYHLTKSHAKLVKTHAWAVGDQLRGGQFGRNISEKTEARSKFVKINAQSVNGGMTRSTSVGKTITVIQKQVQYNHPTPSFAPNHETYLKNRRRPVR